MLLPRPAPTRSQQAMRSIRSARLRRFVGSSPSPVETDCCGVVAKLACHVVTYLLREQPSNLSRSAVLGFEEDVGEPLLTEVGTTSLVGLGNPIGVQ